MKIYKFLPKIVISTLLNSHGWLVGSSIRKILISQYSEDKLEASTANKNTDFDILVPDPQLYQQTILLLYAAAKEPCIINSCGGLKFNVDGVTIDIWPESLDHFIANASKYDYLYNFKHQTLLKQDTTY